MNNLRPDTLDGIIGNKELKKCLNISINSARLRNDTFPHILLSGPPGLGKTTFAYAIANELNAGVIDGHGGNLTSLKNVSPYFGRLRKPRQIFFIDEIHRTSKLVQELLFTAMEDYYVDPGKGIPKLKLEPFTLIGATTETGTLLKPLLDRFVQKHTLYLYSIEDLSIIIKKSAEKLNIKLADKAVENLAVRSRGTPRVANNYLLWIRDYAYSKNLSTVSDSELDKCMLMRNVGKDGTDRQDKLYINTLRSFGGGPIGLNTLVATLSLSKETIEHNIEPFLLRLGKIRKTSKGRVLC